MKKIALIIIFIVSAVNAFAELNSDQLKLRADIQNFLQIEGYQPSIDSDGDIKVKIQGDTYYIKVSDSDTSPMYVTMSRYFEYPEKSSKLATRLAVAELSFYKMVKILCFDSQIRISTEMFVQEPEAFKYAFYKMSKQIQSAANDFYDECTKAQKVLNDFKHN